MPGPSPPSPPAPTETTLPPAEQRLAPGERVDRYRITGVLGSGGMGMVYSARDDELDRTIALKLVHTGASSSGSGARARVVREARAIAKLSHPNVVAVFDVGVHEDDVFLAMELAERGTLRSVLESRPHTWRQILDYYLDAGRGLAAAHAVGLVHRDFKPDNALVGRDGRAKVADFGIARALQDRTELTPRDPSTPEPVPDSVADAKTIEQTITEAGAILGTPGYMAPEQMHGRAADERSDVFSYCVALYEGLYGERPFAGAKLSELRENVESQRIAPHQGARRVPSWVRAAVVRGLAPEPSQRWPSMQSLLDALMRDPEVLRRRRLRTAGVVAGFVVAIGLTALVTMRGARPDAVCAGAERQIAQTWGATQARAMEQGFLATGVPFAKEAYAGTTRAFDAYADAWARIQTDACEATRLRKEQSEELLDLRMQCLRERREELGALADAFAHADGKVVERAQSAAKGLTPLDRCADAASLRARHHAGGDAQARAHLDDLAVDVAKATALYRAGKYDAAERIAEEVLAAARAAGDRALAAAALKLRGQVLLIEGDYEASERALQDATLDAVAGRDERVEAAAWATLARTRSEAHHFDAARDAAAHAHACLDRDADDALLGVLLISEATIAANTGDYDADLAFVEQSRKLRVKVYGDSAPEVAVADSSLAGTLFQLGRFAEALPPASRAIQIFERDYGPTHPSVADTLNVRSGVLGALGRNDEALADAERSVDIFRRVFGKDTPRAADPLMAVADVLREKEDFAGALERSKEALAIKERSLGPDDPEVADALGNVVGDLVSLRRYDEALADAERGLAIYAEHYAPDNELVAWPLTALGHVRVEKGDYVAALEPLERALALRQAHPRGALQIADVDLLLGTALYESRRDRARGKALVEAALAAYVAAAPAQRSSRAEAEATLARWR